MRYDFKALEEVAYQVTLNLNKVIDINFYPTKETKKSMNSGNLSKFFKEFDTPRGTENTNFLPKYLIIKL